ncbi:hypothetical protein Lfu02_12240 [Longispora fulva]|uniref:Quinol monooxygenase YgiN n=1 Tax=Longispora fulva TaxID=619741 RepID=A0A8J7KIY3_9ACTN|nr:hypothetical protein [Longispora fulva]MBG6134916.1 quinol monooxygenase YgiN [Longispora fulva]GIG56852.1 hypothetical protein Lfu02_12240 [Longispora fulva]
MSFVQIVTFSTDRVDEFRRIEAEWWAATEGRRTLLRDELYADRDAPGRYVAITEFASYESAMVNSALPETDEAARRWAELATGPVTFTNLDRVEGHHRPTLADLTFMHELFDVTGLVDQLVAFLETSTPRTGLFTGDVVLDLTLPHARHRIAGVREVTDLLAADAPAGRRMEERHWTPTPDGFVLQWAWRTADAPGRPGHPARGVLLADVRDGEIGRLTVHGSAGWDAV